MPAGGTMGFPPVTHLLRRTFWAPLLRPRILRMLRLLLLMVMMSTGAALPAGADEAVAPFVAGYGRFGRHGEIDVLAAGRLLLSELSCTACHASEDESLAPKSGPRLDGVADRLDERWLRRFLASPQTVKPGTTMPEVLAG